MPRPRLPLLLLSLLVLASLAVPLHAQQACNLAISVSCSSGHCISTTINNGSNTCSGTFISAMFAENASTTLTGYGSSLGLAQCLDSSILPPGTSTSAFGFCFGDATLAPGASFTASANVGGATASVPVLAETFVEDPNGNELAFVYAFNNVTVPTCTPGVSVPPVTLSGVPYSVTWTAVSQQQATYIVEESTTPDFSVITATHTTTALSDQFVHTVSANASYYYRVHAQQCSGAPGPLSATAGITVQAAPPTTPRGTDAVVPFGTNTPVNVPVSVQFPASGAKALGDTTFTATTDKPYTSVSPSSGSVPSNGTVSVTVTAQPGSLPPGANTSTVTVTTSTGQTANVPVSISLVTPVTSSSKTQPPANSLIIPIVTHVAGFTGPFQSDVRLTNTSGGQVKYQVSYTPTQTDGTQSTKSTTVPVDSGQTIALNDIVRDFFGTDAGAGALEIRPVNNSTTLNYASSRTFVTTNVGTLGQFIAALPFSSFASKAGSGIPLPGQPPASSNPTTLSFQQVSESAKFRTNFGVVEGSGNPVSFRVRAFDDAGHMLAEKGYSLRAGEHKQFNSFIKTQEGLGLPGLDDGRIEIVVDSPTGAVSGYASVLDNVTTDPLAVMPATPSQFNATRYVLPGMAEIPTGNNFHSDIRVYNGGTSAATVTPTFYPQNNGAPVAGTAFTLNPGEVKAVDNALPSMFNVTLGGGSIVFTTPSASNLVTTGRTYSNADAGGTFGQFIPGVAPSQGIGTGDTPLQILQLEESQNFRSNLGLAELTGNPVHVKITATVPDSKVAANTELDLAGNEFRQLGHILGTMFPGQAVYNARITVQVLSGSGRITAYGSVIDNVSADPTYVPAQ